MRNKKSKAENHLVTLSSENVKSDQESQNTLYNPEFVEKILRGREEIKEGKGVKIDIENLWKQNKSLSEVSDFGRLCVEFATPLKQKENHN